MEPLPLIYRATTLGCQRAFRELTMEAIIKQLRELGYNVLYEYNPMEQRVYYQVWCGEKLLDLGLADELNWEDKLRSICQECDQRPSTS